jgi:hypothetical protein
VAQASNQLVNAAQQAGEFSEDVAVSLNGPMTLVGSKAQEYEQAVKILQLEKQLENARKHLFALRRKQYAKPSPLSSSSPSQQQQQQQQQQRQQMTGSKGGSGPVSSPLLSSVKGRPQNQNQPQTVAFGSPKTRFLPKK